MSSVITNCAHDQEVIDPREGTIICFNCGIIKDNLYLADRPGEKEVLTEDKFTVYLKDLSDKLHFPIQLVDLIMRKFKLVKKKDKKLEKLLILTLETLNAEGIPLSLKELASFTEFTPEQLFKVQTACSIILPLETALEKATKKLNLNFQQMTAMKKDLIKLPQTGHNPLTKVASVIYKYCLVNNLTFTLHEIAYKLDVSPISIKRYYTKYLKTESKTSI